MVVQVKFSQPQTVNVKETVEYKWDSNTGLVLVKTDTGSWEVLPIQNSAVYKVPPKATIWGKSFYPFLALKEGDQKSSNLTVVESEYYELYR